ncbi:substrate-binding domain-containing protein [Nocardioides sp. KIGAM211]|uniref:Substrate-binding domain-containing protein n=1 Tax=Nocardioides luti TaxID=2761101 RepID=A0A7X0REY0_9ACTN|nr:substrate-binding domain-containing protein [Nocardioides luti]MBB6627061.1 substrate-binding domain-containing protein [Nocardioides luti]
MFVRKTLSGLVAAAVAGSALALSAAPALAATDVDDTTFTPVAGDLIGVGSDTSQHALKLLADAFNAQSPAPTAKLASFAATGGGTITLPSGAINRPNGSGAGKALLYGSANNPDVDFARSSSALSTAETQAGLQTFPFALDTLAMAVSNSVPSHAPVSLTAGQIVDIYKGNITNWSQVGGQDGVIAPKIPQAGSGTRSFFVAQLKAANGGADVALGAAVTEVQEHDDSTIKSNPDAVAPFSVGRAGLLGTTLRIEDGFRANRALYNVVRGTDVGNAAVQAAFAENGFVCSTAARPLIEQAGFKQLATPANGGACGAATQTPTGNFALNQQVVTTSTLDATSPRARVAHLVAAVSGSTSPQGTFDFYQGETLLTSGVPLVSGQATYDAPAEPGTHDYTAIFRPAAGFDPSQASDSVLVTTSSSITESFPATVKKGKRATGKVTVTLAGVSDKATGVVKVLKGTKTVGKGTLSNGVVKIKLAKLTKGKNKLKAVWAGNAVAAGSSKSFTIKQK